MPKISTMTFPGPHPLSEPETKALHKHMEKIRPDVLSAISVHSYGKDIYYPKVTENIKKYRSFFIFISILRNIDHSLSSSSQGWLSPDDPEQFSEDRIELYKKFAGAFNKALNFKYVLIDNEPLPLFR